MLKPGSFSRNFAWGSDQGLRKLHSAIRAGFSGEAVRVERDVWRKNSGVDGRDQSLLPVNFFLLNDGPLVVPDELVLQALNNEHDRRFDMLALFSLQLSYVGTPPGTAEDYPTLWANEFIRRQVWIDGAWRGQSLTDSAIDAFLLSRLDATEDVRNKVRNNYRHILRVSFRIGDFATGPTLLNTRADEWVVPALSLAWDRRTLRAGPQSKDLLVAYASEQELYKLLGVPKVWVDAILEEAAVQYLELGGLNRLQAAAPTGLPLAPTPATSIEPEPPSFAAYEQAEFDLSVRRSLIASLRLVRNQSLSAKLKKLYENECTFCGLRLPVGENEHYSEAAHIQAVGKPHNGPDTPSNMLVLCPHHHLQFDRGVLSLRKAPGGFVIQSLIPNDQLRDKLIVLKHAISESYVLYHSKLHGFEHFS